MNKTECLSPAFSLQDFGTFSNCFSAWSDSDPDSLIVHVPTNNSFGRVISTCIRAYCRLPKIARENCCAAFNGTEASLALSTLHYVDFQSAYCSNTSLTANPDVAGPGVCICICTHSYLARRSCLNIKGRPSLRRAARNCCANLALHAPTSTGYSCNWRFLGRWFLFRAESRKPSIRTFKAGSQVASPYHPLYSRRVPRSPVLFHDRHTDCLHRGCVW